MIVQLLLGIALAAPTPGICAAAQNGDLATVAQALDSGADVDACTNTVSPLQYAALNGHLPVVALLIQAGADLEHRDSAGDSALLDAAYRGHAEVVAALLAAGAEVDGPDPYGGTPLMKAARYGHAETARVLLAGGADPNAAHIHGDRALVNAAIARSPETVDALLRAGAEVDVQVGSLKWSPLGRAALYGDAATVGLLLAAGADPDVLNADGLSPLLLAAQQGHEAAVRVLLDGGADPDLPPSPTPLVGALRGRHLAIAELLWPVTTARPEATLAATVALGDADLVRRALAAVPTPDPQLLVVACTHPDVAVLDLLVAHGVALEGVAPKALGAAAANGRDAVVTRLLALGVPPDRPDSQGTTPLMLAAAQGHVQLVQRLLELGADPQPVDDAGRTVDDYMRAQLGFLEARIRFEESKRSASLGLGELNHDRNDLAARHDAIRALLGIEAPEAEDLQPLERRR